MAVIKIRKGTNLTGVRNLAGQRKALSGNPGRAKVGDNPKALPSFIASLRRTSEIATGIITVEMIRIEAGTFPVEGSNLFGRNNPIVKEVKMSGFYAGKYPVTVAEFREFAEDSGYLETIKGQDYSYYL